MQSNFGSGRLASGQPRLDLVSLPVQDHGRVRVDIYWREDPEGRGPACSLYAFDREVLRIDAFGGESGHLHLNVDGGLAQRWYFQPGPIAEHVERACFELAANVNAALKVNRDPRLERLWVDRDALARVAAEARNVMHELTRRHSGGGAQ